MKRFVSLSLGFIFVCTLAAAKDTTNKKSLAGYSPKVPQGVLASDHEMYPVRRSAGHDTTVLAYYTFDAAYSCDAQGWTSIDLTAQPGEFFHVDDFTSTCGPGDSGRLVSIEGTKSLWCGACPDSASDEFCRYATLPGYGDGWDQSFCTKNCVWVDSLATVDYYIAWDSEPAYDATYVDYDRCDDNWNNIAGGIGVYDGIGGPVFSSDAIPVTHDSIRVRFRFSSDGAWSDQDGRWPTDGAVIIDSLTVRSLGGIVIPTEDFEGESVGDITADDWESCPPPGYGDLSQLIRAIATGYQNNPVQEDPCVLNFTCMWNFYNGSTAVYYCNQPDPSSQQPAIPYVNSRGQYVNNEIWSPWIPLTGSGSTINLEFDVYRDQTFESLIFFVWHVLTRDQSGCPSTWVDRGFLYHGGPDWLRMHQPVADLIPPGTTDIKIGLGVIDMCPYWCGLVGTPDCHPHTPLFDNVALYRVASSGPRFSVRDIDLFQDNFSSDGTIIGTARADMAQDIARSSATRIIPGDSVVVTVGDPEVGLGEDAYTGCGPAVYCYVSVDPARYTPAAKQAPETRAGLCGGLRYPYAFTTSAAGRTWDVYRMDSCVVGSPGVPDETRFCFDFRDDLFVPGDTCWFFFEARNTSGTSMFFSMPAGETSSLDAAAANADEFTILPAVGSHPGNDILYVDGYDHQGAQPYFDSAFENMNILHKIDRYDVRGSDSRAGNLPGGRVVDAAHQLIPVYRKIIWNTGDLSFGTMGGGDNDKTDDAALLHYFLNNHPDNCGIYLSGDDIARELLTLNSTGAYNFRNYIRYTLVNDDHADAGAGINPAAIWAPDGSVFHHTDSLIVFGGCPGINNFDVIAPVPSYSNVEMNYAVYNCPQGPGGGDPGPVIGGAIVSQTTATPAGGTARVVLSGFSFHYIRDIDNNGIADRYHHLYDIITHLMNAIDEPISARPNTRINSLAQNYPNPFNPVTTIKYTLGQEAYVSLRVYNVAGQLVRTLVNEVQKPGEVTPVEWQGLNDNGQQVSSGVYFYRLVTKDYAKTRKMVLLK